jgi:histidinol dehydrogenase
VRLLRAGKMGFERYLDRVDRRGLGENLRVEREVRTILRDVRKRGDRALVDYTKRFDGVRIEPRDFEVGREEVEEAYSKVPEGLLETLKKASQRIERFHRLSLRKALISRVERGIRLEQSTRPLERVGIYVPGGKASYPSTVLMAAIPAKIAGVREIVMATPPHAEGLSPAVLVAADLAGVDRIYRIGGFRRSVPWLMERPPFPKSIRLWAPGTGTWPWPKSLSTDRRYRHGGGTKRDCRDRG